MACVIIKDYCGKTCDLPMCKDCRTHRGDIGIGIDYCLHHKNIKKSK